MCPPKPVPAEEEKREGWSEGERGILGKPGEQVERQGGDSGTLTGAENQRHEAERQEGSEHSTVDGR